MPTGDPAPELDSEALAAVIAQFLDQFSDDQMEVAGEAGIKLRTFARSGDLLTTAWSAPRP